MLVKYTVSKFLSANGSFSSIDIEWEKPAFHVICSFMDLSGKASGQIKRCLFIGYIIKIFTVLRYLRPFLIIVLILNTYLLSVQLMVSHYDLHLVQKDHNRNKRNHFLFFVASLVLVSKP